MEKAAMHIISSSVRTITPTFSIKIPIHFCFFYANSTIVKHFGNCVFQSFKKFMYIIFEQSLKAFQSHKLNQNLIYYFSEKRIGKTNHCSFLMRKFTM